MDLRLYYQKIREIERKIGESHAVVVSHETQDGGRAGQKTEAPAAVAARMVVDGTARLASAEEAKEFRDELAAAKQAADQETAASRVQLTLVPVADLNKLMHAAREPGESA